MIRKAIILLLSLATFVTGGLWVLSNLEWPGEWQRSIFGIDIRHFGGSGGGWWTIRSIPVVNYELDVDIIDGWVELFLSTQSGQFATADYSWRLGGLGYYGRSSPSEFELTIIIRLWLLLALFATYPIIAFIRGPLRRYRRRKRGWCIHCGYDLTGNVTGVCSECGKAI